MKNLVILGASAGGLKALEGFVKSLPESTDCAFVIVQHLSPDYRSLMSEILMAHTRLPILEVKENMTLKKDHLFLIPPGYTMSLDQDTFILKKRDNSILPINTFMSSAAKSFQNKCIAFILSGSGFDGTIGCKSIKEAGGLVIAQNPNSAEFNSMPQSIINNKLAHLIIEPGKAWPIIKSYDNNPLSILNLVNDEEEKSGIEQHLNIEYKALFTFLKNIFQLDFSKYKINSVSRRIARRMQMNSITKIPSYVDLLKENREETNDLYRDILIGVTSFFRDTEIYHTLKETVIEPFFSNKSSPDQFRIWIAGCASGEEAYSIAILTDEIANKHQYAGKITIFATDVHIDSVRKASRGLYNKNELTNISEERKQRYFKLIDDDLYKVRPEIRQRIVFAQHNLLEDPPFTHMNLVSCRNMLIYFKDEAQKIALHSLCYATKINGHVLLGSSEALGPYESFFDCISTHSKIFKKSMEVKDFSKSVQLFSKPLSKEFTSNYNFNDRKKMATINSDLLDIYDSLLKKFVPSGVLINREREIQHYFGEVSKYLSPKTGRATNDLLLEINPELKLSVSLGVQKVQQGHISLEDGIYNATSRHKEEMIKIRISAFDIEDKKTDMLLILFEPLLPIDTTTEPSQKISEETDKESIEVQERIFMLEDELRSTKENLQNTVEELQTSNEELQATNEEMQVSNEELQSTNEELHSMNEELHSVNAELQEKNSQLIELNNDHESLLESTEDGVLFLDSELRIKRFNQPVSFAFNLLYQDIGRAIEDIHYKLNDSELMLKDIRRVLRTSQHIQRKSVTEDGIYYMRRFTPFFNQDNKLSGVVLTFTDISEINALKGKLQMAMNSAKMVWWEWDLIKDELIVHADDGNCILGYECESIENNSRFWFKQLHPEDRDRVKKSLDRCITDIDDQWCSEHRYIKGDSGEYAWVREVGMVNLRDKNGKALKMTGTTMNIDNHKKEELSLRSAKESSEDGEKAKANFLSHMSHEIRTPLNGIIGMAEMLNEIKVPDDTKEYIDTIYESSKLLYQLINNVLDFSKAEGGKMELYREWTDIKKEVGVIEKMFLNDCTEKKLSIGTHLNLKHKFYLVDILRLRQIIINLVSNAIKFSFAKGKIEISINSVADGLHISVSDNGVGMAQDKIKKLFSPFAQADSSITKNFGGTGLGLSISSQLVKLMEGKFEVSSQSGEGSIFSFNILARASDEFKNEHKSHSTPTTFDGLPELKNILIVDDNKINLKTLGKMISKTNLHCDAAISAKEGLDLLSKNEYDLILLDIHMPEMSGFEMAEIIRNSQDNKFNKDITIIACTADIDNEIRAGVKKAQMDDIIFKPIKKSDLQKLLAKYFLLKT